MKPNLTPPPQKKKKKFNPGFFPFLSLLASAQSP